MDLRVVAIVVILVVRALAVQPDNHGAESRFKRQLRWNANKYIVGKDGSQLKIDYLQPHSKNVKVLDNRNYMAFTLYMNNSQWLNSNVNTGVFHFIDSDTASNHRKSCSMGTMHAGAYHYFYDRCPADENNVVASGFCYQRSNGLVFNSYTFNDINKPYAYRKYYDDTNRQIMHKIEESLTRACFESWKANDFNVNSWKCPTSGIPVSSRLTSDEKERRKRSSDGCNDCECTAVNGSPGLQHLSFLLIGGICLTFWTMATGHDLIFTM